MDEKDKNIPNLPTEEDTINAAPQQKSTNASSDDAAEAPKRRRPPVRYDENGQPIPPRRPPVRYDENGNPIPPRRPSVRYDENGNPIPRKRPPVRYDEDGNPIRTRPTTSGQRPARPEQSKQSSADAPKERATGAGYARFEENEDMFFDREAHERERSHSRHGKHHHKKEKNTVGIILIAAQAVLSVVFMILLIILDLLPTKYVVIVAVLLLFLWLFAFISQKLKAGRIIGKIYSVLISLILIIGSIYIGKANTVIEDLTTAPIMRVTSMSVVVLKDSPAQGLQDMAGKQIGIQRTVDRDNTNTTLQELNSLLAAPAKTVEYSGVDEAVHSLYLKNVDAIIINEAFRDIIRDAYPHFDSETRVLNSFTYQVEIPQAVEEPKEESTPTAPKNAFTIFISGNDAYGTVSLADGRTDVNILATINPVTKQILLTTTPRDYYVELPFYSGCRDKLTHAGVYGMDVSIQTLENLYGVDIDYYVRVNFSGFQNIVDALGGIEVYSDYNFSAGSYSFTKGYNYLYGPAALAFVRERYSFADGDFQRGRHQMAAIKGMINKAMSPSILVNYMGLMDSLSDSFITNVPRSTISDLVKAQLDNGGEWNVVSISTLGTGAMLPTYTYGSEPLSVVIPDEAEVQKAIRMIRACENGEILTQP